jgi:hypothetical protein
VRPQLELPSWGRFLIGVLQQSHLNNCPSAIANPSIHGTHLSDRFCCKRGFQWHVTEQTGAVGPLSGMLVTVPPGQKSCTVALVASTTKPSPALSDWIIESWRWNGALGSV